MKNLKNFNPFKLNRFAKYFSEDKNELRLRLIKNSLLYVNKLGWNEKPIINACLDMDLSSASSRILSRGPFDLIEYLLNDWKNKTLQEIKSDKFENLSFEENIRLSLETRLKYQIPYMSRWNEVMAIGMQTENIRDTFNNLWGLIDDILFTLQDKAIEGEWYLKRSIFLKIYIETEIFMLTDKSDHFIETWNFLKRRFEDKAWIDEKLGFGQNLISASFGGIANILSILKGFPTKHEVNMEDIKNDEENQENKSSNI